MSERPPHRARRLALALLVVLAAPALAGCLSARDTPLEVRTACVDDALPTQITPEPPAPGGTTTPPDRGEKVQGGTPVTIGLLLPPPGTDGIQAIRRGAELAIVQIQTAGVDATLLVEQPAADVASAATAFDKLSREDKASVVLSGLDGATTEALLPLAKRNRAALIAVTATEASLSTAQSNDVYFWRVTPPDALEGNALTELLLQSGCRTAAVIHEDTVYGNDVATAFLESVHQRGGSARERIRYTPGDVDAADIIRRVSRVETEAVVLIASDPDDAVAIVKAAYGHNPEEGWSGRNRHLLSERVFFFPGPLRDPYFVQESGSNADGRPLISGLRGAAPTRVETPAKPVFEQSYALRYSESPTLAAAAAYDAAWIAALAVQCAKTDVGEQVALQIRHVVNADSGDAVASGEDPSAALTVARNCNVNYVGAGHDYDLDAYGDPVTGPFLFWIVGDDGAVRTVRTLYEP